MDLKKWSVVALVVGGLSLLATMLLASWHPEVRDANGDPYTCLAAYDVVLLGNPHPGGEAPPGGMGGLCTDRGRTLMLWAAPFAVATVSIVLVWGRTWGRQVRDTLRAEADAL